MSNWKTSGTATKQSNFGRFKTGVYRGEGINFENIFIAGDNEQSVLEIAKNAIAAPETAAERDRLKDVLFQRDSRIEQLEHNAKVHLAAAVDMQNEISDLKKQLTKAKADFQVCHRSATVRIHEVKALNEELAGALEAIWNIIADKEIPGSPGSPLKIARGVLAKHKAS